MSTATSPSQPQSSTPLGSDEEYILIYHPVIPGRAEFIRLCFETTNTAYTEVDFDTSTLQTLPEPHFAPPILKYTSPNGTKTVLSQTPAILQFLGQQLNLAPKFHVDPAGFMRVNELALTALDGLSDEVHETHHPIAVSQYYEDQKVEAVRRAQIWRTERLPKFLNYFERVLMEGNDGRGKWLYGEHMTYVDLVLFQCLEGVEFAFPRAVQRLRREGGVDRVWGLKEEVARCEGVKRYLESGRRRAFGDGIYRRYEELDDA